MLIITYHSLNPQTQINLLPTTAPCAIIPHSAGMMELADVRDSKNLSPFDVPKPGNPQI